MKFVKASVVFILLVLVFSALSTSRAAASASAATTSERPIPSTFFGVSVIGITGEAPTWPLDVPVGTLGKTVGTEWNDLEPSNGTYDWTRLDNAIGEAKSAGITRFVYTFYSTPEWASSEPNQSCILTSIENTTGCAAPPTNINDWDDFVKAVATRYNGVISYYELWNEANLAESWTGTVAQMVTMAQHAYDDIKSIDPNATVISPSIDRLGIMPYQSGCAPSVCWLAEYLQAGGGQYADEIAFHPYACFTSTATCSKVGIACPQGEIQACAGTPLVTEIQGVRSITAEYGLSGKPIVATEGGIPSDIISVNLTGSADQQTAYLSRWFILQASENVSTAVWFTEFPSQNGLAGFGTLSAEVEINQGYMQTYDWLVGSTFSAPCSLAADVWTCSIVSQAGYQEMLVWADTNSSGLSYAPPGQFVGYQDLSGAQHQVPEGSSVSLDEKPILLETVLPAASTITSTDTAATSSTTDTTTASSTGSSTQSSLSTTVTSQETSTLSTASSSSTATSSLSSSLTTSSTSSAAIQTTTGTTHEASTSPLLLYGTLGGVAAAIMVVAGIWMSRSRKTKERSSV